MVAVGARIPAALVAVACGPGRAGHVAIARRAHVQARSGTSVRGYMSPRASR